MDEYLPRSLGRKGGIIIIVIPLIIIIFYAGAAKHIVASKLGRAEVEIGKQPRVRPPHAQARQQAFLDPSMLLTYSLYSLRTD